MSSDQDAPDWSGALSGAIVEGEDEEDTPPLNIVSSSGLGGTGAVAEGDTEELPYVTLLYAACRTVQSGEITIEQFVEGVSKLDVITDNALKIYAIPAVKKDLPGKLTDHQNSIVNALEGELHNLKKGLTLMLSYAETKSQADLEEGTRIAVASLNASRSIQKKADTEYDAIMEREKGDKARRAQQATAAEEEDS